MPMNLLPRRRTNHEPSRPRPEPPSLLSRPVAASFPSTHITQGAGVAIFHLASSRVVLCYHSRDRYWFLPKGRLNRGENARHAAEREGFEESGFRNRILPLPISNPQTDPDSGGGEGSGEGGAFATEAVWTQFLPLTTTRQYLLFWFIAETVSPDAENALNAHGGYCTPDRFPAGVTLEERMAEDVVVEEDGSEKVHEPVWHEGTGVDAEEAQYRSFLLPVDEAMRRLGEGVMQDVIRRGWDAIQLRMQMEAEART